MEKTRLRQLIAFLIDMVININLTAQLKGLNNSLSTLGFLRKKATKITVLLGLLLSGVVISWGLLIILMVLGLHDLSFSWLKALCAVLLINLLVVGLIVELLLSVEK